MPIGNPQKGQNLKSNLFDYDDNELNGEWSFNLGHSIISTEVSNNETSLIQQEENTIVVNREFYEELLAISGSLKDQLKELDEVIGKKKEEDQEFRLKVRSLELELEGSKKENKDLLGMIAEEKSTTNKIKMKIHELSAESQKKEEELMRMKEKYNDLKKRGLQMLEQRDKDINKMQKEMAEQKEKLDAMELAMIAEKEKRRKYENEVKTANRMIKQALLEEKISRKQMEKKCLKEKTEKLALEEKVKEMSTRGVVLLKECPVQEHDLLAQRIDVLQRQRDILVDSINQRESIDSRK
ncbi:unnamed protein product [Caenorhabditis brenneri]